MPGPLLLALRQITDGVQRLDWQLEAGELGLPDTGAVYEGKVAVDLAISRSGERFHISGEVRVPTRFACVRCLEPLATELRSELQLVAEPEERRVSGEEVPEGILYHDGESLDLTAEVRESVLLEIPANPVCAPDCRGLCPHCGANLNRAPCACAATHAADPRWNALRGLLQGQESGAESEERHEG